MGGSLHRGKSPAHGDAEWAPAERLTYSSAMALRPADIPPHIVELCRKLRAGGFEAHLVGGAVRDLLHAMPRPAQDFDIATSAKPAEVARVFGRKRVIPTGEKHGTV